VSPSNAAAADFTRTIEEFLTQYTKSPSNESPPQFVALAFVCGAGATYPARPIRFVVPFAPGGSSEIVGRSIAAEMSKLLGQQVYVENKPGAAGNIAMAEVAKAEPDGYTLIMGHIGTLAVNPYMFDKLPYDADRDFIPVSLLAIVHSLFVVNASVPAKDLKGSSC
jgi:tripartite-type tricarboxylate transporter receptor subunit TctC